MCALIFFLVGCTSPGDSQDDSGTTADDSATEDSEDSEFDAAYCLAYNGIQSASSRWVYSWDDSTGYSEDSTFTAEVVAYDADAGTAKVLYASLRSFDGNVYDADSTLSVVCTAEGLAVVRYEVDGTVELSDGTSDEHSSTAVFDPPELIRPVDLAVGDEWSTASTSTTEDDEGEQTVVTPTKEYVVGADDVPAGNYTALRVDYSYEGGAASALYFTPQVGEPLTRQRILEEYTP
jgi:hypothetical protein